MTHHEKYPSDLNATFDLMLKTFNLYYNSWTIWDKCLIFHMCIPYLKAFLFIMVADLCHFVFSLFRSDITKAP